MFSIFKKKACVRKVDLSGLQTDMHSHLVPDVDDGSKTVEDSLVLIQGLQEIGYKKLITTPHIMSEIYPNSPETILPGLELVKQALHTKGLDIQVSAAAEYYLDDVFDEKLAKGEPLLTISKNLVLAEFSFVSAPLNVSEKLFQMQLKGYQPVLAHPERYLYFGRNKTQFDEFKSMGCLFQLNLLSLAGYYGKLPMELAHYLISKDQVDLLGTDMHHLRHLDTLRTSGFIMDAVDKLLDSGRLLNATL